MDPVWLCDTIFVCLDFTGMLMFEDTSNRTSSR